MSYENNKPLIECIYGCLGNVGLNPEKPYVDINKDNNLKTVKI